MAVLWLIGLSGAGKTTIAKEIVAQLREKHSNVALVDGDTTRGVWGDSLTHDVEGRGINAGRVSRLCKFLDDERIHVVAAILSIFPEWQMWNRRNLSRYFEVYLDVPFDVLVERDTKGLYRAALTKTVKNVVGVDIPFPRPPASDLVLQPPEVFDSPASNAKKIIAAAACF